MRKKIPVVTVAGAIRDGLLAFASATGQVVMHQMMQAELTTRIGPKHARIPGREGNWHGTTTGQVVLGGRKVSSERPGAGAPPVRRSPWTRGRCSPTRTC